MEKLVRTLLIVLVVAGLTGCGTIMQGTTQKMGINSNPVGAQVTVDGVEAGQTPMTLTLSRKTDHTVSVTLPGYENFQIMIDKKFSKWTVGSLLLGGPIGLIIDHSTGGMYRLTPEQLNARLNDRRVAQTKVADGVLYMDVVLEADPNWEQIGTLTVRKASPSTAPQQ